MSKEGAFIIRTGYKVVAEVTLTQEQLIQKLNALMSTGSVVPEHQREPERFSLLNVRVFPGFDFGMPGEGIVQTWDPTAIPNTERSPESSREHSREHSEDEMDGFPMRIWNDDSDSDEEQAPMPFAPPAPLLQLALPVQPVQPAQIEPTRQKIKKRSMTM